MLKKIIRRIYTFKFKYKPYIIDKENGVVTFKKNDRLLSEARLKFDKRRKPLTLSLYILYKLKWKLQHIGKEYKGMTPVCMNEWYNNEFQYYLSE